MHAELTRSDVLRALIWPNAGLLLALVAALTRPAPDWILLTLVSLLCGFMLLYAATYVFCLFKDRDALRSEKYKLQKMAIEHGLYGDDSIGLIDIPQPPKGKKDIVRPMLSNPESAE